MKTAGAILYDSHDTIDAFADGIRQSRVDEGKDAPKVMPECLDELAQRFEAASERGRRPTPEETFGCPRCFVFPELFELVFESPGSVDPVVGPLQRL